MAVAYFDHDRVQILEIIDRIISYEPVLYAFVGTKNKKILISITLLKITSGPHISDTIFK